MIKKLTIDSQNNPQNIKALPNSRVNLSRPNWQILQEITDLTDKLTAKKNELGKKKLELEQTKVKLKNQLVIDEVDLKKKVITVKKRENISNLIDKLRQQEQDLQNRINNKIADHPKYQKLSKSKQKIATDSIISKLFKGRL